MAQRVFCPDLYFVETVTLDIKYLGMIFLWQYDRSQRYHFLQFQGVEEC